MDNLEDNLRRIKIKELSEEDKESLWRGILFARVESERNKSKLLGFNILSLSMKKIIVGVVSLAVVLGGGGVAAASSSAVPGSSLFPVELALENIQLKLAKDDKKEELRVLFAEERLREIREVSERRSATSTALVANLSNSAALQIEADVFTNETVVKIEADDKDYGYISSLKVKAELVKEISLKYSLAEEKVGSLIDFEVEDRSSRSDDKEFLNKTRSINFSDDESEDVGKILSDLEAFLGDGDASKEDLRKSLSAILVLLGDDGKLEIKREDGKIKIESKDGELRIKMEGGDDSSKSGDKNDDSDDKKSDDSDDSISIDDVREDENEVFCRGEWRDPEDCVDDDNSGSTDDSGDDEDGDEDEGDDEGGDSGKGGGSDD